MPINLLPLQTSLSHVQVLVARKHAEQISTLRFALTVSPCRLASPPPCPLVGRTQARETKVLFLIIRQVFTIRRFQRLILAGSVCLSATLACLFANGCGSSSALFSSSTTVAFHIWAQMPEPSHLHAQYMIPAASTTLVLHAACLQKQGRI